MKSGPRVAARIKVCGLTRAEDAKLAVELGAWALGFIFHAASPRATTPANVAGILKVVHVPGLKTVGVFVNASAEEIRSAVLASGINTVQLHGEESPAFCHELKTAVPKVSLIKALRLKNADELKQLAAYASDCEAVLLDTYVAGTHGGTGVTGDWELVAQGARRSKIILAGGLNPGNIRAALRTPGIFAVDASSGLEDSPGKKSSEKMKKFFENALSTEISA